MRSAMPPFPNRDPTALLTPTTIYTVRGGTLIGKESAHHCRKDICKSSSQFKHYHSHRNCQMHNSTKSRSCSKESIGSRRNAWNIGFASRKECGIREGLLQGLDDNANHAAERRTNSHRRHEDSSRHFAPVGYNDQNDPEGRSEC